MAHVLASSCLLPPQLPITAINSSEVWVASFGISAAKMAAEAPKDIALGSFADKTRVSAVGERHFVYHANIGRGDSGGAVINLTGQLVGIHLGGWNDASPPPSPETAAKGKAGGAGAVSIKNRGRAVAMGMAEVGSATRQSILKLASQLPNGGYSIYVCSPKVAAMCSALMGSAGAGGGGAAADANRKRPWAGGGGSSGKKGRV